MLTFSIERRDELSGMPWGVKGSHALATSSSDGRRLTPLRTFPDTHRKRTNASGRGVQARPTDKGV